MHVGKLTDSGDYDDMSLLPLPHNGEYSFDDIHVGKEVDLEDLIYQTDCPTALGQFFDSTNDSFSVA